MKLSRRGFLETSIGAGMVAAAGSVFGLADNNSASASTTSAKINVTGDRPNILYIIMEDVGPHMACYGEPLVKTPHIDNLASQGIRFTNTFGTAPVCSASRSALMTGCYQTLLGAHQHRTWEWHKRTLLPPVQHISQWFRDAGYYTCNLQPAHHHGGMTGAAGNGKIDLNFFLNTPKKNNFFDGTDWSQRAPNQPFFAHITVYETHKGEGWKIAREQSKSELVNPNKVKLPAYYPDSPIARDEYANYLDVMHLSDGYVGQLLERLNKDGLAQNTIVVLSSDHGPLFRGKQFLYDGGIHIPLIIKFPDGRKAGTVNDTLVSGIDIAPTLLGLAGIVPPPGSMQGRDVLAPDAKPREYIFAARDRMDIAIDRMRAVRTKKYKYIRNYLPAIPYMQKNPYKEANYPTWNLVKESYKQGKLSPTQALFAAPEKPIEELYDLHSDPDEVNNLAKNPAYEPILSELRPLVDHFVDTNDKLVTYEDPLDVYRGFWGKLPEEHRDKHSAE